MNSKKKNWSLKELQINAYRTLNKRKILIRLYKKNQKNRKKSFKNCKIKPKKI